MPDRTLLFHKGQMEIRHIDTVCEHEDCTEGIKGFTTYCPQCELESPLCDTLAEAEELAQAHTDLHLYGPPNASS